MNHVLFDSKNVLNCKSKNKSNEKWNAREEKVELKFVIWEPERWICQSVNLSISLIMCRFIAIEKHKKFDLKC